MADEPEVLPATAEERALAMRLKEIVAERNRNMQATPSKTVPDVIIKKIDFFYGGPPCR